MNNNSPSGALSFIDRYKKIIIWVAAALLLVSVAAIALVVFRSGHTQIGQTSYSVDEKVLVFDSPDITSTEGMERFSAPESIDLRGSSVPADQIIELIELFPDCDVRWTVPVASGTDSHTRQLTLTASDDVSLLKHFPELTEIDARGLDYGIAEAAMQQRSDCTVLWDMEIAGQRYGHDTETISVAGASAEELRTLTRFRNLKEVDAVGSTEYDTLLEVSSAMPDCRFLWTVTIGGIEASSTDTVLNFNRRRVTDIAALDKEFEKLKYLPNLEMVDMCGCRVSSEQMAVWRDKYPESKFVWEITFGNEKKRWTVRTDIKVFSTLLGDVRKVGNEETYKELLVYCTDLVALDLGHNEIRDLTYFKNLKKLQGLILTDNPVSDFSPLAELPELQYLEINMTRISDLTPFTKLEKLLHLDVYATMVRDISPLYECDSLQVAVLASNGIRQAQQEEIKTRLPNCSALFDLDGENRTTRNSPLRGSFRLAFMNYRELVDFVDWEHVTYEDGAQLKYPKGYREK